LHFEKVFFLKLNVGQKVPIVHYNGSRKLQFCIH